VILPTFAGSQLMELFIAWYYSFSPSVAGSIGGSEVARSVTRTALYPLIRILHVAAATCGLFSFNSEAGVVMAGLVASSLIGVVYFSTPLAALLLAFKRLRIAVTIRRGRLFGIPWLFSLALVLLAEFSLSRVTVAVATRPWYS